MIHTRTFLGYSYLLDGKGDGQCQFQQCAIKCESSYHRHRFEKYKIEQILTNFNQKILAGCIAIDRVGADFNQSAINPDNSYRYHACSYQHDCRLSVVDRGFQSCGYSTDTFEIKILFSMQYWGQQFIPEDDDCQHILCCYTEGMADPHSRRQRPSSFVDPSISNFCCIGSITFMNRFQSAGGWP